VALIIEQQEADLYVAIDRAGRAGHAYCNGHVAGVAVRPRVTMPLLHRVIELDCRETE